MSSPFVSIVIPVLDDAEALGRLLPTLRPAPDVEILVVNGGPPDPRLAPPADRADVQALLSPPGRGRQMNVGALSANGRWFVFLHADTRLPPSWPDEVRRAAADPAIVGGSFRFQLDSPAWQARLLERGVACRVRWFGLAYGDQALFVRRDAFHALGGYREWPLMEDIDLIRRLRRIGRLYHSPLPAVTSARRWEGDGWGRRTAGNLALQLLFLAGAPPAWLARRYGRRGNARRSHEALVVMARAPSDSRGKSRLTRGLAGDPVELRRAILLDTFDAARRVSRADLFVAFEPATSGAEFQALVGGAAQLLPQQGATLGERMHGAFAALFDRGYSSVVMVGSDLPTLPAACVDQAFDCLRDRESAIVIGPAADGGYYLIGLRALAPELFESIPWSTPDVLASTRQTAERLRLKVALVRSWYDVDDADDLRRALSEAAAPARTRSWVAAHPDAIRPPETAGRREP